MSKTALGLVHAHTIYRQGMHYHLASHPEFEIAGEASNGQQAIQMVEYANPDIVVMEVDLPGVNGLEVARAIKRTHPDIAVVLLGNADDRQSIVKAIRAGVSAYLPHNTPWDNLLGTLRQVRRNDYPINDLVLNDPKVAAEVLDAFRSMTLDEGAESVYSPMSPREIEVLELVAAGRTNKEIAARLAISNQTVKNHISSILRKLQVNDRTQAVVYAMRRGWIKVSLPDEAQR